MTDVDACAAAAATTVTRKCILWWAYLRTATLTAILVEPLE